MECGVARSGSGDLLVARSPPGSPARLSTSAGASNGPWSFEGRTSTIGLTGPGTRELTAKTGNVRSPAFSSRGRRLSCHVGYRPWPVAHRERSRPGAGRRSDDGQSGPSCARRPVMGVVHDKLISVWPSRHLTARRSVHPVPGASWANCRQRRAPALRRWPRRRRRLTPPPEGADHISFLVFLLI